MTANRNSRPPLRLVVDQGKTVAKKSRGALPRDDWRQATPAVQDAMAYLLNRIARAAKVVERRR